MYQAENGLFLAHKDAKKAVDWCEKRKEGKILQLIENTWHYERMMSTDENKIFWIVKKFELKRLKDQID